MLGMFLLALVACVVLLSKAHAQVRWPTDPVAPPSVLEPPIQKLPANLLDVVWNVDADWKVCIAWFAREDDRFGDYELQKAALDVPALVASELAIAKKAISERDLPALIKLRNLRMDSGQMIVAMLPCMAKLKAPPSAWTVAPAASGIRAAFLLNHDYTRGPKSGTASTTIKDQPMWCNCKIRSVETTSSNYCTWATAREAPADPVRVTLCRESK